MTLLLVVLILALFFGGGGYGFYRGGYGRGYYGGIGVGTVVLVLILLWLVSGGYAHAAETSTVDVGGFYEEYVKPFVIAAIGACAAALVGIVFTYLQAKWALLRTQRAIELESHVRDVVQTAAMNAAGRVIAKYDGPVKSLTVDVKSPAIAEEINKTAAKIGPELQKLNVSADKVQETVGDLIVGKVGLIQAAAPAVEAVKQVGL